GKERRLDLSASRASTAASAALAAAGYPPRPRALGSRVTEAEAEAHRAFLLATLTDRSLWNGYGLETA
ncbi:MAG TPA: DNA polymerase III subunit epsilon, partial [Brevundimonas sp.]|nr:DNA polymerase III subunit epsilon [Brevundimonas sp.]